MNNRTVAHKPPIITTAAQLLWLISFWPLKWIRALRLSFNFLSPFILSWSHSLAFYEVTSNMKIPSFFLSFPLCFLSHQGATLATWRFLYLHALRFIALNNHFHVHYFISWLQFCCFSSHKTSYSNVKSESGSKGGVWDMRSILQMTPMQTALFSEMRKGLVKARIGKMGIEMGWLSL